MEGRGTSLLDSSSSFASGCVPGPQGNIDGGLNERWWGWPWEGTSGAREDGCLVLLRWLAYVVQQQFDDTVGLEKHYSGGQWQMSHRTHHLPICTHVDDRRVRQRTPFSNTCVSKTLAIAKRSGMTLITTIYWLVQRTTNQALIAGCSSHPTSDKAVEPLSSNHNPPLPPILDTVQRARVERVCTRVPAFPTRPPCALAATTRRYAGPPSSR